MKIDYLKINSRFKNLDQVEVQFDENHLMTVIVGWNGAGKSNVLEALVTIFRNLDLGESPLFAYELKYKLGDNSNSDLGNRLTWVKVNADPSWGDTPSKQYKIQYSHADEHDLFGAEIWSDVSLTHVTHFPLEQHFCYQR